MKLFNKKTGEIVEWCHDDNLDPCKCYDSLAEICEDWEDYKGPKGYWFINDFAMVEERISDCYEECFWDETVKKRKAIGNHFETKEEAEKAVEKLKAWKRLKDAGIKFDLATLSDENTITVFVRKTGHIHDFDEDIFLIFGGEK